MTLTFYFLIYLIQILIKTFPKEGKYVQYHRELTTQKHCTLNKVIDKDVKQINNI